MASFHIGHAASHAPCHAAELSPAIRPSPRPQPVPAHASRAVNDSLMRLHARLDIFMPPPVEPRPPASTAHHYFQRSVPSVEIRAAIRPKRAADISRRDYAGALLFRRYVTCATPAATSHYADAQALQSPRQRSSAEHTTRSPLDIPSSVP